MKRACTPCEGENYVPEAGVGLKGVGVVARGDGDGASVPEESTLGLRVHEWGLNPLFWVSGCDEVPGTVLIRPNGKYATD